MTVSTTRSKERLKEIGRKLLVLVFWLALWQLVAFLVNQEILLATPVQVAVTLWGLWGNADFWLTVAGSLLRILAGLGIGLAGGTLLAVLTANCRLADRVFSLPLEIVKATPVASFIILALVWLSTDSVPVFCVALMVLPIVWSNLSQGIKQIDPRLKEMAFAYRLPFFKRLWAIHLPQVMPYFMAALQTSIGFSWKSGIAAEVIALPEHSVGNMLHQAKIYLETPELFAWTAVVILLSILLEKLLVALLKKAGRKFRFLRAGGEAR